MPGKSSASSAPKTHRPAWPVWSAGWPERQVAGGPLSEDVLKCALKALDPASYRGLLSASQLARLAAVFPSGVCDWTRPGVGQQEAISPVIITSAGLSARPAAPLSRAN